MLRYQLMLQLYHRFEIDSIKKNLNIYHFIAIILIDSDRLNVKFHAVGSTTKSEIDKNIVLAYKYKLNLPGDNSKQAKVY